MQFAQPMKKLSIITAICVAFMITAVSTASGDNMNANDMIIVPEPKLSRFVFGGYELDKAGTVEHYERMFEGRTAEDVVRFLEERGFHVFYYENPAEIGILLERLVTFFYYRVKINFAFEGGVFESARIGAHGVK